MWAKTAAGKRIPLDAEDMGGYESPAKFADGNVVRVGSELDPKFGSTLVVNIVATGGGSYRSHFASCADGDSWRKR